MGKMILTDGLCGTDSTTWSWLTDGTGRYAGNRSLKYFNASLPNLTTGFEMFKGCTALSAVEKGGTGTMTALNNATSMFEESGIVYSGILPIQGGNATAMYKNCKNLKRFFADGIKSVNCDSMLEGCSNLNQISIAIGTGETATIASAIKMFKDCTSLHNIEMYTPGSGPPFKVAITGSSESMFEGCTELTSFPPSGAHVTNMPNCKNMFAGCINLRAVYGETPIDPTDVTRGYVGMVGTQITNAEGMFAGCTSLTEVGLKFDNGDYGIECGNNANLVKAKGMFGNDELGWCKLDFASALNIAMTITDLTGKTSDGTEEWGKISIGLADGLRNHTDQVTGKSFVELLLNGDTEYANDPEATLTDPDGNATTIQRAHIARGLLTKGWAVELHGDDITTTHEPTSAG